MLKLIRYLIINRKTRNPMTAARIYQMIYHPELSLQNQPYPKEGGNQSKMIMEASSGNSRNVKEDVNHQQRQNLQEELNFLRRKPNKTLADRTSIDMLEAVIRNL